MKNFTQPLFLKIESQAQLDTLALAIEGTREMHDDILLDGSAGRRVGNGVGLGCCSVKKKGVFTRPIVLDYYNHSVIITPY